MADDNERAGTIEQEIGCVQTTFSLPSPLSHYICEDAGLTIMKDSTGGQRFFLQTIITPNDDRPWNNTMVIDHGEEHGCDIDMANIRTIQKQKDSFVVTIPKDVMVERGWKAGDRLIFDTKKGAVAIYTPRDKGAKTLFTVGYEGIDVATLLTILKKNGIEQLIDVRKNAISRKSGFSKEALRKTLEATGIVYTNISDVGTPKDLRENLGKNNDFNEFLKSYRNHLRNNREAFNRLRTMAERRPTAIMCFEKDWRKCHRRVLSEEMQKSGFQVFHL